MKNSFRLMSILLMVMMFVPMIAQAQQFPPMPVDSMVRIGKLPNGLTYYIRHNEYPKGQADFYIAQKVGSINEEDSQRGLAHFLEHMCFNGTTNFPGKNLINWLESIGVKFGANLNAYTSVDQTVYNISNVPVAREGVQDSCLLILHDWANDLLLLPEEIEAERGVIHEEWRRSMAGQMRILENLLPTVYPGSRYGYRLPIGTMEVVDNFSPQTLRDYYEKWYRPDLQGIIVVGDIDVDRIEGKIKEMFSNIEMPENPAERIYFPVDDNEGTIYAIGHDKEQTNSVAMLMIKSDAMPREARGTMAYYVENYMNRVLSHMLNTRLDEISAKPGAPFAQASVGFGDFFLAKTKDALDLSVAAKTSAELPTAIAAAYREVLRAARGGFTVTEFERAKAEILSASERAYNNRNQRENRQFVNAYVNNFLDNDPIPDAEVTYQVYKQLAAMLPLEAINQAFAQSVTPGNRVLLALMPDNADGVYPTEEQFASALASVDAENIEPYKEEVKSEPLIPSLPKPGKITKETTNAQWGTTEWTLSNGAKVVVKPTKYKEDEILFSANALNGTAAYGADYAKSLNFMPIAFREYGLGTYTNSDLSKYLSGKQASLNPSFSLYSRTLSGFSTPKDLPTLMELIYMSFTNLNFSEEEFAAMQDKWTGIFHNQESDPQYIFSTKIYESLFNSPRVSALSVEDIQGAQRAQILEVANAMTANAAEFTFTFVGNVDIETLRPLVEQYIATLPANAKKARKDIKSFDPQFDMKGGKGTDTYSTKMETPQTWLYVVAFGDEPYTMRNAQLTSVAAQILSKRLLDIIREEKGATYSIGAYGSMDRIGNQNITIQTQAPIKPEMKEEVLPIIEEQFALMAQEIKPEELDKIKEYMVKSYVEGREKNAPWLSAITGMNQNGVDTFNGNVESINAITTDDVKDFFGKLLQQGNYRVVVLDPEQ